MLYANYARKKWHNLIADWKELIASGIPPLTLTKCKRDNLIDYKIYGNSVQDGEPTPETPMEVESVGDKTVNLADMSKTTNGHFVDNGDGSFTLTKLSNNSRFSEELYPVIPANTTFYIKAKILEYTGTYSQKLQLLAHLADGTTKYINTASDDFQGKFTYTSDVKDMRFYSDGSNPDGTIVTFKDFIISTEDVPYEPYNKYKIPVISRGKNLLNYKNFVSRNQSTLPLTINDDGSIDYNGDYYIKIDMSHLKSGKTYILNMTYTFDGELVTERMGTYRYEYEDGTLSTGAYFGAPITSDATKKIKNIFCYFKSGYSQKYTAKAWDIILVEGSTTEDYEPYVEPIKTNIYLNEPLRKMGDYADYIDFKKKKVIRNIKKVMLDSNNPCSVDSSNPNNLNRFAYIIYNTGKKFDTYTVLPALCNMLANLTQSVSTAKTSNAFFLQYSPSGSATMYLYVDKDKYPTVESIRAVIDNKAEIYMPFILPEETMELPNISTLKGTTILEINSNINSSYMEAVYKGKGKLELLNVEDNDILNSILNTDTNTDLNITNTEIIEILDEIIGG